MSARISAGRPFPLGATWDGHGVNFAVFSERATSIDLCLFDEPLGAVEVETSTLPGSTDGVFHGYVEGLAPGQLYGLRARGPWDPARGLRFNANKLVLDPYARAVANEVDWREPMFPCRRGQEDGDLSLDARDNARGAPKSVVVHDVFDWGDDRLPDTPWTSTVLYEAHLKGLTMLHPEVPPELRGTYAGLATEPVIDHLKKLGVTAVELLPIHEIVDEPELITRGLVNYWGYSTAAYFAPAGRYSRSGRSRARRGEQVREFKAMVRALHEAGIEVILDVVYNHTAEGGALGPQLSLRGLDNVAYYRLDPSNPRRYADFTGTGSALDIRHPAALKLVMDSLRYWAEEMHVDGFRFDLATVLARDGRDGQAFDRGASFLDAVYQDPVLARRKLIAEPWDVAEGGYQVGGFPRGWREWNGRYRDGVRRFWHGRAAGGELAFRLTGSSDVFEPSGRGPDASINFVTAHDGFTLRDLVSYDHKHNEANGESNRDGTDANDSWNHGVEGDTDDPAIGAARLRQMKNLLLTLAISQGVPMLLAGDELGRTQRGNNNAYCQDNEVSWVDWTETPLAEELVSFVQAALALRREEPVLRRRAFFRRGNAESTEIAWLSPEGRALTLGDWESPRTSALGMVLADASGTRPQLLVLVNGSTTPVAFTLPPAPTGWAFVLDTARPTRAPEPSFGASYGLTGRSMAVLRAK